MPFSSAENFQGGNQRKGSFITSSAKNTLICSWTVSFLESTGTKTGTKPDPTIGFSEKKPQEICVAYAGGFFVFLFGNVKYTLHKTRTLANDTESKSNTFATAAVPTLKFRTHLKIIQASRDSRLFVNVS